MKLILIAALTSLVGFSAQAQTSSVVTISDQVHTLPVDLSTTKLKVTNLGYANLTLKVLIPELAEVTLLDHRNEGEEAPCMATFETLNKEDVLQGNPEVIEADIRVVRRKIATPIVEKGICSMRLEEQTETEIRGFNFVHYEAIGLPDRHIDDCK